MIDQAAVCAYRLSVTHLDRRLGSGDYEAAAGGGLQDSFPRSGLLSLHARMEGVGRDSWEVPRLVQVWFRGADYLVPRVDVGVFTLGSAPRDRERRASLEQLADAVVDALDGRSLSYRELLSACPALPDANSLSTLAVTGKVHIRWDASKITIHAATPDPIDEEQARVELLRRFLHWLGPATAAQFARWAGVSRSDAETTWKMLESDLSAVSTDTQRGWILASDRKRLSAPTDVGSDHIRLLPAGDPYLYPHAGLDPQRTPAEFVTRQSLAGVSRPLLNSLLGRLLLRGKIVGSWGRAGGHVTIGLWRALTGDERELVSAELARFSGPLGREISVYWLEV
ncbi:MAG: winged helix DNA-binding domain-containing protein [Actinomycetota bacterium]|nr:winged helix DNA-binding domain-containing protein [Actinomycetota bacterium]